MLYSDDALHSGTIERNRGLNTDPKYYSWVRLCGGFGNNVGCSSNAGIIGTHLSATAFVLKNALI